MQTVQTDLTILGAHTPTPAIYWKGQQVTNVSGREFYFRIEG